MKTDRGKELCEFTGVEKSTSATRQKKKGDGRNIKQKIYKAKRGDNRFQKIANNER